MAISSYGCYIMGCRIRVCIVAWPLTFAMTRELMNSIVSRGDAKWNGVGLSFAELLSPPRAQRGSVRALCDKRSMHSKESTLSDPWLLRRHSVRQGSMQDSHAHYTISLPDAAESARSSFSSGAVALAPCSKR